MSKIDSNFCKIIDAYIFTELYKRQAIRSKSFTFSNRVDDIRSKLMYVLKSLAISIIKENELESVFPKISFSNNTLSLEHNIGRNSLLSDISTGYIRNFLSGISNSDFANYSLRFSVRDLYTLLENKGSDTKNIKEELNAIINNIFFIQNAISDIGKYIKVLRELDETELKKLKYTQYLLYSNRNGLYNTDINACLNILNQLKELSNSEAILNTPIVYNTEDSYKYGTAFKNLIIELNNIHILGHDPTITEEVVAEVPIETPVQVPVQEETNMCTVTIAGQQIQINLDRTRRL